MNIFSLFSLFLIATANSGGWDLDSDGLSNWKENEAGSDVHDYDTDDDGLNDYEEVIIYGTNPSEADTDHGGAGDCWELYRSHDPLSRYDDIFTKGHESGGGYGTCESTIFGPDVPLTRQEYEFQRP